MVINPFSTPNTECETFLKKQNIPNENDITEYYRFALSSTNEKICKNLVDFVISRDPENRKKFKDQYAIDSKEFKIIKPTKEDKSIKQDDVQKDLLLAIDAIYRYQEKQPIKMEIAPPIHEQLILSDPLLNLPKEILYEILGYLEQKDLLQLQKTCKFLSPISLNFLKKMYLEKTCNLTNEKLIEIPIEARRLITKISVHHPKFSPQEFANFIDQCPFLTSVEFHRTIFSFDDYIAALVVHSPALTHLKIVDCQMHDRSLFELATHPSLCSLEIHNNKGAGLITDYGLIPFFTLIPNQLQVLNIFGCPKVSGVALEVFLQKQKKDEKQIENGQNKNKINTYIPNALRLKNLHLSYLGPFFKEIFYSIGLHAKGLKALELNFSNKQCETEGKRKRKYLYKMLKQLNNLQSFKLTNCSYIDMDLITYIADDARSFSGKLPPKKPLLHLELHECLNFNFHFFPKFNCPQLRTFKFTSLKKSESHLSRYDLQEFLLNKCPVIEELSLKNCTIEEEGITWYLEMQTALRSLELVSPGPLQSEKILLAIGEHCPKLENLILELDGETKQNVNDELIGFICERCPDLKTVRLTLSPTHLHNPEFHTLSVKSLEYLTQLKNVTDVTLDRLWIENNVEAQTTLNQFIQSCSRIKHLGLPFSNIPQEGMLQILDNFGPSLLSLNLEGIVLSDAFFEKILKCERLEFINLKRTTVSLEQLKFMKDLPNLKTYLV